MSTVIINTINMNIGDYLHFRAGYEWDLYYKILGFNAKSIRVAAPLGKQPTDAKVVHRVDSTSNFSSGTPILTINGEHYRVRIQKRKRKETEICGNENIA